MNKKDSNRVKRRPWKAPIILSSFTEDQLVEQKDALTFLGDWKQVIWGQG